MKAINTLKLATLALAITPFMASADNSLDIRFDIDPDPGSAPCVVVNPPVFDIGSIPATGAYHYDFDLIVECEDPEQGFNITFPRHDESNGITIYSDAYLDVYAGFSNEVSQDGYVRHNGYHNVTYTDCRWSSGTSGSTDPISVAGSTIYAVGGTRDTTGSKNRNTCTFTIGSSPTGIYEMRMRAIAELRTMPTGDDLENMPKQIVLPMDFVPQIPTED